MIAKFRVRATLAAALLLAGSSCCLIAQSVSSAVQGTVADSSGAVVPNAAVVLTNAQTGVALRTQTDEAGNYAFPSIQPGIYSLKVTKDGFAQYSIASFNVIVGQHETENATLNVSATSQSVAVDAQGLSNLLQTDSNDLGTVIGPQSVAQLPLNGRNYLQLGLLSGASQTNAGPSNGAISQTGHPGVSINIAGNEPDYTMYLVNGIQTIGTRAGNTSLNLSVSAIDQFEVHYGFFMPDEGTNPGIVDVITKSGTNQIHGGLYEFVRTNQMEARDYFANVPPGPYHQNQFGFDAGGPILHNRLFWFANYEGYRQSQSAFVGAYAPIQAMFNGDFSALSTPIYDPTTYNPTTGQRQQFAGNIIPPSRINGTSKQLLAFYLPGSSLSATPNNVGGTPANTLNSDQFTGRFDDNLNDRNQIFAQGSWLNAPANQPGLFPSQGTAYPLDTELVALGWTWTLGPSKVSSLRLGVVRDSVYDQGRSVNDIQGKLNITGTADPNGVPGINIAGFSGFGTSTGLLGDIDNVYQIHEGFNWLHGNHSIKIGGDLNYTRSVQSSANANARGVFNFNDIFTAQSAPGSNGSVKQVPGTGSAFADFLLGDLATGQSIGMRRTHYRWTTMEPYIQDSWKIRHNLTANLALAWYGNTSPNPSGPDKNLIHSFDFNTGLETFAALGQTSPESFPMTQTNFAPRIGFSYQPGFSKNSVIRAGWGLYYTTQMDLNAQYAVVSQIITVNNNVSNSATSPNPTYVMGVNVMPSVTVGQITAAQVPTITGAIQYLDAHQRSPMISQWNLDIQHTFGSAYMLDLAYIGNEAHHLARNWNPWDCSQPDSQVCNPARNNPYYGKYSYMQQSGSTGDGSYNAFILKFQRQFVNGISVLANYTWSKALSDGNEGNIGTLGQNKSCFRCDWGMAAFNVPQSLVISTVANVPVGRGRRFGGNLNRLEDAVIGGWSVDAIVTMRKGNPFTVTAPNNTPWSPAQTRADRKCNGRNELQNKNLRTNGLLWLQKSCFVNPATDPANTSGTAWAFGNSGFDILTGPGLNNWDTGVHKTFPIHEAINFQLRGEFFNTWNHAQFANPNSGVVGNTFGQVSSTQHDPREIQIGGVLSF